MDTGGDISIIAPLCDSRLRRVSTVTLLGFFVARGGEVRGYGERQAYTEYYRGSIWLIAAAVRSSVLVNNYY